MLQHFFFRFVSLSTFKLQHVAAFPPSHDIHLILVLSGIEINMNMFGRCLCEGEKISFNKNGGPRNTHVIQAASGEGGELISGPVWCDFDLFYHFLLQFGIRKGKGDS